ncbi:hypothetical protein EV644_10558 [Kribbella orskensis]|uniref:Uncharacterized protein n=1 Tax=Kribbella orskensis TaxID=2512216 RepID=A0ABY2BNG4_9ACTN|nr:hypothetical protein EV642_10458 [Kribbella sp. VKM Ac-2500]TCO24028.1 hypothetical protein EV644_10558 [Kribbella orskensis]
MTVLVRAELTLLDGGREEFVDVALALAKAAEEEPGTGRTSASDAAAAIRPVPVRCRSRHSPRRRNIIERLSEPII